MERAWIRYPKGAEGRMRDHRRAGLTGDKVPKLVAFIDALPKTDVGKILRKELRGK